MTDRQTYKNQSHSDTPATMVYPTAIPRTLKQTDQWVCWKHRYRGDHDKPTKVPVDPETGRYASTKDPATWTSFTKAHQHYHTTDDAAGIGFVFTGDDPYVGVDLDDCRDPGDGRLTDWAKDIIRRLDSYTEASPSGTGVHVIVRGDLPAGKQRSGGVEMYDRSRYFTVTGDHLDLTPPDVYGRSEELAAVHDAYVADDTTDGERVTPDAADTDLDDEAVVRKAMQAANGDKFQRLWCGDTSGYPSHSEADQALCNILAYWTGGDPQQMERLFEKSGLVREKWRNREDYRERTISKAIRDATDFYD